MAGHSNRKSVISALIVAAFCLQHCCHGQSTTVRPYKFGFSIDKQQHRSEQRDERGIVMGEFGFITADGIYHVTVYATDEQGRFRILAMKNYPYESTPKTVEVMVQPKITTTTTTTTTTAKPLKRHNFNTEACSGCFLTNGKNKPKGTNGVEPKATLPNPNSVSAGDTYSPKQKPSTATKPTAQPGPGSSTTSTTSSSKPPPIMDIIMQKVLPALVGKRAQTEATNPTQRTKLNAPDQKSSSGKNAPAAANADGDLYRFKYILDYHGHSETGKRNGNKEGSYYVIGDDNVERSIEYVANEFGYQPRIRWRKLNSNEIKPKENSLKDYEFIWFKE